MSQYLIKPMGNKATHNSQWRNMALKYKSKHVKKTNHNTVKALNRMELMQISSF